MDISGLSKAELMKAYDEEETRIENIKKEQAEATYNAKRQAEEVQKEIDRQIYKKYIEGATLKSLKDEFNVTQANLNRIFKKYKIPKQTS